MAGAYRQVADEALTMAARATLAEGWLRPLFEAVEQAGAAGDYWVFDSWLLRFERAFSCDDNSAGHPDALIGGLRRISTFFRGDERIAFELGKAHELRQAPETSHQARFLYERMVRAVGTGAPAVAW